MVGVIAHQGGEIEGDGEAGLALAEEIMEAAIGFFRRRKTGELPHGPQAPAIHGFVNTAGVGEFARRGQVAGGVEAGKVLGAVKAFIAVGHRSANIVYGEPVLRRLFAATLPAAPASYNGK